MELDIREYLDQPGIREHLADRLYGSLCDHLEQSRSLDYKHLWLLQFVRNGGLEKLHNLVEEFAPTYPNGVRFVIQINAGSGDVMGLFNFGKNAVVVVSLEELVHELNQDGITSDDLSDALEALLNKERLNVEAVIKELMDKIHLAYNVPYEVFVEDGHPKARVIQLRADWIAIRIDVDEFFFRDELDTMMFLITSLWPPKQGMVM